MIDGKNIAAHRIVYEAFSDREISPNKVINHINGIKGDNRPENLEEITQQENCIKATREVANSRFKKVGAFDSDGTLLATFPNATAAAESIGILSGSMRNSIRR